MATGGGGNNLAQRPPAPLPLPEPVPATTTSNNPQQHGSQQSSKKRTSAGPGLQRLPKACRLCGQPHSHAEPHLYNYKEEVDEDLTCQICLQPFVEPVDTPCGHTFCKACLLSYLKVNPMCPLDRKPLNEMVLQPSNLVLRRLLDKQMVMCPNSDSCTEELQRGSLDDHLKYRCSGTLVACQYAGAGCDFRGPKKTMPKHQTDCKFQKEGITRLPVLEGEVSHVEIPRTSSALGMTIVGGADTPLRCVVVQEVYHEGLISSDGRLQPGDQVIEINGVDMTCAPHAQVCAALRKMTSVLRLGIYRERIEKYRAAGNNNNNGGTTNNANNTKPAIKHHASTPNSEAQQPPTSGVSPMSTDPPTTATPSSSTCSPVTSKSSPMSSNGGAVASLNNKNRKQEGKGSGEDLMTVTLERVTGRQLGIRLSGGETEPTAGIFVADIQEGSTTEQDGRLLKMDRILFINGRDVRNAKLTQASALIQNNDKISLVVARKKSSDSPTRGTEALPPSRPRAPSTNHQRPPLPLPPIEDEPDLGPMGGHDEVDAEIAGIANSYNSNSGVSASGAGQTDADGLTISHARSKSAPAIHNKNKVIDRDEDDDLHASNGNVGRNGGGVNGTAKSNGAAPASNGNYDSEDSDNEGPKDGDKVRPQQKVPFSKVAEDVDEEHLRQMMTSGGQNGRHLGHNDNGIRADKHVYDIPEGDDYMAIYETIDSRKGAKVMGQTDGEKGSLNRRREQMMKSHSMEALETPTPSVNGDANEPDAPDGRPVTQRQGCEDTQENHQQNASQHFHKQEKHVKRRHRSSKGGSHKSSSSGSSSHRRSYHETVTTNSQTAQPQQAATSTTYYRTADVPAVTPVTTTSHDVTDGSMAAFLRKALRIEGPQLCERTITIKKTVRESLGMRIGGGIGSNEGDTPIYVANIHPHGCIGKSKQLKKGDILLSVDDTSLCRLTHSQAVATLKATINHGQVVLGIMDGPETSYGASNFIPSWMYWQKLPRSLQYPKTVILHRKEFASWGFSIVGGAPDTNASDNGGSGNANNRGNPTAIEPIHVLFVVPESPAAKDAKLKCGDRLLAVDGHSLESIPHHLAVKMLKQTSTRVVLEVVSWMGTEL